MKTASLQGKRILVTRARRQAEAFSREIAACGAIPVEVPVLDFRRSQDPSTVSDVLVNLMSYHWIVFTSANGVHYFFTALRENEQRFPKNARVAVVGKKTLHALHDHQIQADIVPEEFIAEDLFRELKKQVKPSENVLLPRGNLARRWLADALRAIGADVCDLVIYETAVCEDSREALINVLSAHRIDAITFTSSSTVRFFRILLADVDWRTLIKDVEVACIGPIAAETARNEGVKVDVVAKNYTTTGLLNALETDFEEGPY